MRLGSTWGFVVFGGFTVSTSSASIAAICLVLFSFLGAPARADEAAGVVDQATAAVVAARHLAHCGVGGSYRLAEAQVVRAEPGSATLCYYFDLAPAGHVVVSADRALPPVVAYSFTSPPNADLTPGSPLGDLLRWDLGQRLAHADELSAEVITRTRSAWTAALADEPAAPDRLFQQWPPAGTTPTGGWVLTNWSQGAPYNNLCPKDLSSGNRCVAGCPAVAMSQIVDYHSRLNGTRFDDSDDYYHNYGGNQYWIDDAYLTYSFPSFPQLNVYLDGLSDAYFHGSTPSNTHVAALVFACGVACKQVYTASVSGTFGVNQAFDAYQKFNCDTAVLMDDSDPHVYDRIAQNMMDALPAHLAVVNTTSTAGHNLVIDGYNTDGYYHLNFGWGGSYNGWYLVPSGLPMNLTVLEGVIVDIMTTPCPPMDCTCDGTVDADDFAYYSECFTGPAGALAAPGCAALDADGDGDVDVADFSVFQTVFGE